MPTADEFENASRMLDEARSDFADLRRDVVGLEQMIVLDGGTAAAALRADLGALIARLDRLARAASSLHLECRVRSAACREFDEALRRWHREHRAWALGTRSVPPAPTPPEPAARWIESSEP